MKNIKLLFLSFIVVSIFVLSESCDKAEDLCITQNIECQNGGSCVNGSCDCPPGYVGPNCELIDTTKIQFLLNGGKTPKDLYEGGVTLEQLYGKMYEGGLIFYLNTTDGTGMVAATKDQGLLRWGCVGTNIMDLADVIDCLEDCLPPEPEDIFEGARIGDGDANTTMILAGCTQDGIATKLCREIGDDWFLPSRGELTLMYTNLKEKGHGSFLADFYWSSTEGDFDYAWFQNFYYGFQGLDYKGFYFHVRAARAF